MLETRKTFGLSQKEAANLIGIPVRTLRRYENDNTYGSDFKRTAFIEALNDHYQINEEKGLLTVEEIKEKVTELFNTKYKGQINFCYLFCPYVKGNAKENSDVDIYVSSSLTWLKFASLIEAVRTVLNKKVDLIRDSELENNIQLVNEILKVGIKIYG